MAVDYDRTYVVFFDSIVEGCQCYVHTMEVKCQARQDVSLIARDYEYKAIPWLRVDETQDVDGKVFGKIDGRKSQYRKKRRSR